jgi:hypothetical protein
LSSTSRRTQLQLKGAESETESAWSSPIKMVNLWPTHF